MLEVERRFQGSRSIPLYKINHPYLVTGLLEAAILFAMLSARDWFPGNVFHISLKA